MKNPFEINYYELLDIPPNASEEQISKAYSLAKQTFKSDSLAVYSLFDETSSKKMLEQIDKAYSVIGNPERRKEYDAFLENPQEGGKVNPAKKVLQTNKINKMEETGFYEELVEDKSDQEHKNEMVAKMIPQIENYDGSTFKQVREILGYSLEDVSQVTKIRLTYIKGIEEEDFAQLPARLYIRGFVKNCSFLGLPAEKASDDYMKKVPSKSKFSS